jgi:threonine aldolase
MRRLIAAASVGDDVFSDDPTVNQLQEEVARLLEKEAALFVPTGTMANLIALMTHCNRRGDEVIVGDRSHITVLEQGGVSQIAGIHPQQVTNLPDGTMPLDEIESKIFHSEQDNMGHTRLLCVENTHTIQGGRVIKPEYMDSLAMLARKHNLKIHLDGARIMNASAALGIPPAELAQHADTVSMCMSKGLGAPAGSLVVGSRDFINQARHMRRVLGGGMRQVGILAAAGLYGLHHISKHLHVDHENAKILANGLYLMKDKGIEVNPEVIETNIVFFSVNRPDIKAINLAKQLEVPQQVSNRLMSVKIGVKGEKLMRALLHHQISRHDVEGVLQRIHNIVSPV